MIPAEVSLQLAAGSGAAISFRICQMRGSRLSISVLGPALQGLGQDGVVGVGRRCG